METEDMEWKTSQENSTSPHDKTENKMASRSESLDENMKPEAGAMEHGPSGLSVDPTASTDGMDMYRSESELKSEKPSKQRDVATFYISDESEKPTPQRVLLNSLKAWFDQTFSNKIKELTVKSIDDERQFEVNISPSSAFHFLDHPTTIQLTTEKKEFPVKFLKTPELRPDTQQPDIPTMMPMNVDVTIDLSHYHPVKKGVLLKMFAPYAHSPDRLRRSGSFDEVEQFIKDVKAVTAVDAGSGVPRSAAAAAEAPGGVHSGPRTERMTTDTVVPLTLFWYASQAYKKELQRIESDNGVQIRPEVKLSFIDVKNGEDSLSNKAPEDFIELIRKCANDFASLQITLPHSNPELPNILQEIQREEARCILNVSSKECTMFVPRESMPSIQRKYGIRQNTSVKSDAYEGASISSSENNPTNIGMGIKDPLCKDGLTMEGTHWTLMKTAFGPKISDMGKKFGVQFKEHVVGHLTTVKAEPAGAGQAPSLQSHALRALVPLYQRVATSTLSCSLMNQSQAREVAGKLGEIQSRHPCVGTGSENGPWRMIGLPEHLGPAVYDLERTLGASVFKEEDKQRIGYRTNGAVGGKVADEQDENCPICMDAFVDKEKLKCGHEFCSGCIKKSVASQLGATCPVCKSVFGQVEGDQPPGNMSVHRSTLPLPGFRHCGSITIHYDIPSGIQTSKHPSPGKSFCGTTRTAYLPDNKEGNKVLKLLERAFNQKLIFTVGTSRTNGMENCVTWNDVHHKTTIDGGPSGFGYPDPHYLSRVTDELKAKGIEEGAPHDEEL